eukprot:2329989-Pyramimonas_sp.AAC.1
MASPTCQAFLSTLAVVEHSSPADSSDRAEAGILACGRLALATAKPTRSCSRGGSRSWPQF